MSDLVVIQTSGYFSSGQFSMKFVALRKILKRRMNGRRAAVEEREGICVTVTSDCEKRAINLDQVLLTWRVV